MAGLASPVLVRCVRRSGVRGVCGDAVGRMRRWRSGLGHAHGLGTAETDGETGQTSKRERAETRVLAF